MFKKILLAIMGFVSIGFIILAVYTQSFIIMLISMLVTIKWVNYGRKMAKPELQTDVNFLYVIILGGQALLFVLVLSG